MGKIKEEIAQFLKENRLCVLCTCRDNESRATPVTYWSDGLTINIFSEKFTAKFQFLEKNPKVSIGIYTTRQPDRGLQLWGRAEVITHDDPRHEKHLPQQVKKDPKLRKMKKMVKLIQVTPYKILVVDQTRKGRHFLKWEVDETGKESEKEIKTLRAASQL
ncbi:MAG: pyridoxamine 5'-phosphate oxidase family protein [Nitrospira sp.]|nr:pyridoxamine 5'-phosphate oxidase family protein [Nitrospira sp.]